MGGGGQSTHEEKTTQITTTTTTNIRDIGLTGANTVDMAAVLEAGAIERTAITADLLKNITQTVGGTWQQLVGGANQMIQAAQKQSVAMVGAIAEEQSHAIPIITKALGDADRGQIVEMGKSVMWVSLACLGLFLVTKRA